VRATEFDVSGLDAEKLSKKIHAATAYARAALENLSLESLDLKKSTLSDGRPVTTGWALLHALEHTAIHLGHIQITRQLWEQEQ
jgi:hypothetical protein